MPWSHLHVKKPSRKSHVRHISRNEEGHGYLVAVTGSTWLLQGLHGCNWVYVPLYFAKLAFRASYGTAIRVGGTAAFKSKLPSPPFQKFIIIREDDKEIYRKIKVDAFEWGDFNLNFLMTLASVSLNLQKPLPE